MFTPRYSLLIACVTRKANWALGWLSDECSMFTEHLVGFTAMEDFLGFPYFHRVHHPTPYTSPPPGGVYLIHPGPFSTPPLRCATYSYITKLGTSSLTVDASSLQDKTNFFKSNLLVTPPSHYGQCH
jgi:hypothetical protein